MAMRDTWSTTDLSDDGAVTTTVNLHELLLRLSRKGLVGVREGCTAYVALITMHDGETKTATVSHAIGRDAMTESLVQLAGMVG